MLLLISFKIVCFLKKIYSEIYFCNKLYILKVTQVPSVGMIKERKTVKW